MTKRHQLACPNCRKKVFEVVVFSTGTRLSDHVLKCQDCGAAFNILRAEAFVLPDDPAGGDPSPA